MKLKRELNETNFGFTLFPEVNVANLEIDYYPKVKCVDVGSQADLAGLRAGDFIIEVNGKSTFQQEIVEIRPWILFSGQEIEIVIKRKKMSCIIIQQKKPKKSELVVKYSKRNDSKLSIINPVKESYDSFYIEN